MVASWLEFLYLGLSVINTVTLRHWGPGCKYNQGQHLHSLYILFVWISSGYLVFLETHL